MTKQKELHFFLGDSEHWGTWNLGIDWYNSLFANAEHHRLRGEASPGYTVESQTEIAARKARDVLGSPKLIYFVREPISRLKSHYLESYYGNGSVSNVTLDDIVSNRGDPKRPHHFLYCDLVQTSMYARQLERVMRYHSLENIFIGFQEDLSLNTSKVLQDVFGFLGVDTSCPIVLDGNKRNVTAIKRKRVMDPLKHIRSFALYSRFTQSFPESLKEKYRASISRKRSNSQLTFISAENLDHLNTLFEVDARRLRKITGIADLWRSGGV